MTSKKAKTLYKKFCDLLKRFGRGDWSVKMDVSNSDSHVVKDDIGQAEAYATVYAYTDRDHASLHIAGNLGEYEDWILTHEALHVIMANVDATVEELEKHLSPELWRFFFSRYKDEMDAAINRIAFGILEDEDE